MKLEITIYKCSGCSVWGKYASEIKKHCSISSGCCDRVPICYTFEQEVDDPAANDNILYKTPGPKPLDIYELIRGRTYAFDSAVGDRIDYLFETEGLIDKCLGANMGDAVPSHLVRLFVHLWGQNAPMRFQSIFVHAGTVYEIIHDYEEGNVTTQEYGSALSYFNDSFYEEFLGFIRDLCVDEIPARRPDLQGKVQHILEWTEREDNMLTIRDVYEKNEKYIKYRHRAQSVVTHANILRTSLKNAIATSKATPRRN
jgi:23S rRNA maturation mini-RNase III